MIERLKKWINGNRDFKEGVAIYFIHGSELNLKRIFLSPETEFSRRRLNEELLKLYNQHKDVPLPQKTAIILPKEEKPSQGFISAPPEAQGSKTQLNPQLEKSCLDEANLLYKQMMADRAVLFSLCRTEHWEDPNTPDRIEKRRALALSVAEQNYQVSKAYDTLAYVRKFGRLPSAPEEQEEEPIPDSELKHVIDNMRKNLSKMKRREQTPERVSLIQSHTEKLNKLLERWDYLKSGSKIQ